MRSYCCQIHVHYCVKHFPSRAEITILEGYICYCDYSGCRTPAAFELKTISEEVTTTTTTEVSKKNVVL